MRNLLLLAFIVSLISLIIINFTNAQTPAPSAVAVPVYYVDGRVVANAHMVIGQISIPAAGGPGSSLPLMEFPVTLSNGAAFTSADTYKCFASIPAGASVTNGGFFRMIDGSHFVFRTARFGPAWQQTFFCIGN